MHNFTSLNLFAVTALLVLFIFAFSIVKADAFFYKRVFYSAPLDDSSSLEVRRYKEFVGLSFRDRFYLYINRKGERPVRLTGDIGTLPKAKRYLDMIVVRDFHTDNEYSGMGMFSIHYVNPSKISLEEFHAVCKVYAQHRDGWKEIKSTIDTLVYGSRDSFHEVFDCGNGFYIYTDSSGGVIITDDPSYEALTLPGEHRNMNHIGFFDDDNVLTLRPGKIVSDETADLFGRPSKKVIFSAVAGRETITAHVNILWVDLLYTTENFSINKSFIISAKNRKGKRLDEVFQSNM